MSTEEQGSNIPSSSREQNASEDQTIAPMKEFFTARKVFREAVKKLKKERMLQRKKGAWMKKRISLQRKER